MRDYTYLIVGGGMAAQAAVEGIREEDGEGSIGIVTAESVIPYDRPPLSKSLWTSDDTHVEDVVSDVLDLDDVRVHVNTTVTHLDAAGKRVTDDNGIVYEYDKLLLAMGSRPRRLPFDDGTYDIIYYRTLRDYQTLKAQVQDSQRIGVIGGGFIGSEVAYALAEEGKQVTMIFPEDGIAANVLPAAISQRMNDIYSSNGVRVLHGRSVTAIERASNEAASSVIVTDKGDRIEVDLVVAGIGVLPNTSLAEEAGLDVSDGVRVNEYLQTTDADIYAAGDMARFYNKALDEWIRVEHEDNALTQGKRAGRNMAGAAVKYDYMPFFYSDMFHMGYEAVGKLGGDLSTTITWRDDERAVVIYHDEQDTIRGVLMWNVFGEVDAARELLGWNMAEAMEGSPLRE